jgi:hypothetical protein
MNDCIFQTQFFFPFTNDIVWSRIANLRIGDHGLRCMVFLFIKISEIMMKYLSYINLIFR